MLKNKRTCELAIHFNDYEHEISQISLIAIEQIRSFENSLHLERLLLIREAYWTAQLFTLNPHGLNKRREFRSKFRSAFSMVNFDYHCDRHTNRCYQTRTSDYMIKFKGIRIHTLSIPSSHTLITASQEPRIMTNLKKIETKAVKT